MMRFILALGASLFAWTAAAGVLPATPATYAAVFAKAQPGDTLELAPGSYGDGDFYGKRAGVVTIAAADPLNPPVFRSLSVYQASNLTVSGVVVAFTPTATTATWSWATRIQESDHITFTGLKVRGGPAISGLNEDGSGSDPGGTGNIRGRPTGYGLLINHSSDVLVQNTDISSFDRGVMLQWTQRVTISANEVHDTRRTPIVGADNSDLTVSGNYLHSVRPWRWGNGDHADLLALWSNATQTTPNTRVRILGNRMEQTEGEAILGMWLQGIPSAPFIDFEVSGNDVVVNNLQGFFFHDAQRGQVSKNRFLRASAGDAGQSPTILARENTTAISITGNQVGAPISDTGGGVNQISGNTVITGDANILKAAPPVVIAPAPAQTPAPIPQPGPAPAPAPLPDIVINLLPGQTFATSKPGKTYKLKPGQRAVITAPK